MNRARHIENFQIFTKKRKVFKIDHLVIISKRDHCHLELIINFIYVIVNAYPVDPS